MTKIVYNRIKAVLAEEDKSSKELAAALGISEQTVSRWCTNARQPSVEMLYEIAKALNRTPGELLVARKD